jgi:cobalt-zinc-cadmium resistance protein CzcA
VGARHDALHHFLDESAKITPQIRQVLKSFPEVTTVASELARPDDGTDSTGFFNVEFYVGLKPYSEWTGAYRTKAALIEAINRSSSSFPESFSTTPSRPRTRWTRRNPV